MIIDQNQLKEIVKGCLLKQSKEQKTLFDIFGSTMFAICMRYAQNADEAKDIFQEGFIKVFSNLDKYKWEGSFEGWLKRIFINHALEHIRKNLKHQFNTDINEYQNIEFDSTPPQNIDFQKIIETIQTLPTGYRTVFNLFVIDGLSHKEIAEQLHISESTSKSQLFKARILLQEKIKHLYSEIKR